MTESKLLADANLDIKIERGLKVLEFATQYNLRKAYYHNSNMNIFNEQDEKNVSKSKVIEKHQSIADIINQLNHDILVSPKSPKKSNNYLKVPEKPIRVNDSSLSQRSKSNSNSSDQSLSYRVVQSEEPQQGNLQALSSYHSENQVVKLKSIKEELNEDVSELPAVKKESSHVLSGINFSDLNSISQDHSSSSLFTKKSKRQKVEQPSKVVTIPPLQKQSSLPPSFSENQKKELHIQYSSSVSPQERRQGSHPHSQSIFSHHTTSILNKSISAIAVSEELPVHLSSNSSTISEFQLLKELSESFNDRQNIKNLVKLENCQLEQQYLERRIISRLQKGYKKVKELNSLSWQKLHMPEFTCLFKRPNYAHVIQ